MQNHKQSCFQYFRLLWLCTAEAIQYSLNHRITKIGNDLLDCLVQSSTYQQYLPPKPLVCISITSKCLFNTSKDSNSTISLGSLCQCLTTLPEKKFILIYLATQEFAVWKKWRFSKSHAGLDILSNSSIMSRSSPSDTSLS